MANYIWIPLNNRKKLSLHHIIAITSCNLVPGLVWNIIFALLEPFVKNLSIDSTTKSNLFLWIIYWFLIWTNICSSWQYFSRNFTPINDVLLQSRHISQTKSCKTLKIGKRSSLQVQHEIGQLKLIDKNRDCGLYYNDINFIDFVSSSNFKIGDNEFYNFHYSNL